jgi:xanthine dehydrogenase YagR molybdenum-binding subunit
MTNNVIGKPLARVDGWAKVTGSARYAADFNQESQAYAVIVSATVGLGRVAEIDTAAVLRMPGVIAVISHHNSPRLAYGGHKGPIDPAIGERLHVLQDDKVRFYGQLVAVVAAETLDDADRAAAQLHVTYAAERPVVDPSDPKAQAVNPDTGRDPGARVQADKSRGDADGALALAPVKVDVTYDMARENHNPMAACDNRSLERRPANAVEQEPIRHQ